MNRKNVTIHYGMIMAMYSMGYVAMSAFSSLYLLDIGLSNKAVGILSMGIVYYVNNLVSEHDKKVLMRRLWGFLCLHE